MDFNFDKSKQVSSVDLTISQNIQLRAILNECNRQSVSGNLIKWRWLLATLTRELNYDMKKLDKNSSTEKKYSTRLSLIELAIVKFYKDKNKLYQLLDEKEKLLRDVQEESGKGSKRISMDEDDDD